MSKKKNIVYGHRLLYPRSGKDIDYEVRSIYFQLDGTVMISFQKYNTTHIHQVEVTVEYLEMIGFLNWNALNEFCNFVKLTKNKKV